MTATELVWEAVSDGFFRSKGGRFDVWRTSTGYWCAVDANTGRVKRAESETGAKQWCERRASQ